ncbi:pseudouridine synthase [Faunimonas sp. B44]|uniref:pseudouridine synthase n=1 Tax=Faunimonas sp. B44 TaxID=3461493 RepID=UPI004043ACC2
MSGGGSGKTQGGGEAPKGERIAKVIARSGLCSRRDAERLIEEGRVSVDGKVLATPAFTIAGSERIVVDGNLLPARERTRLWLFHKPKGLVTTNRDPEGRPTVFSALPADMPRVVTIGRLDINTEGLLLLTNDGGLARVLELPSTGWLRRYRVRAHGEVTQQALDALARGVTIDGMIYGGIEATLDRTQGGNHWLTLGLREGKNREVKRVLEHLGLAVNRLIRISYGPFQLGDLEPGEAREVRGRVLRDQLGEKLARAAGVDFETEPRPAGRPNRPAGGAGRGAAGRPARGDAAKRDVPARKAGSGRSEDGAAAKRPARKMRQTEEAPTRKPRSDRGRGEGADDSDAPAKRSRTPARRGAKPGPGHANRRRPS